MRTFIFMAIHFALLLSFFMFGQERKEVQTKVTSATVFSNRAMVTRQGSVHLPRGAFRLVLSPLPSELLDESVRVSGKGTASVKILDVKVETEFTPVIQQEALQKLQAKLDSLQWEDQSVSDRITILESQKSFIESLKAESAGEINKNMIINKPSVQDLQELLNFLRSNLSNIYADLRKEKLHQKKIENEKRIFERQEKGDL